jgi:hypothetical protein
VSDVLRSVPAGAAADAVPGSGKPLVEPDGGARTAVGGPDTAPSVSGPGAGDQRGKRPVPDGENTTPAIAGSRRPRPVPPGTPAPELNGTLRLTGPYAPAPHARRT